MGTSERHDQGGEGDSALGRALVRMQAWSRRPSVQQGALGVAALGFVVGLVFSFANLELPPSGIRWNLLALSLLIGVPITAVVNAAEVRFAGWQVGVSVGLGAAFRLAVLGTAANLLPIPGAALLRTGDLVVRGSSPARAARANVGVGFSSTAVSSAGAALAAGILDLPLEWLWWLAALGFATLAVVAFPRRSMSSSAIVIMLEAIAVAVTASRLWLAWAALGIEVSLPAAITIAAANALAALVWIVPSGLAIREALSALLSPSVGLAPAAGVAAQVVDRIVGLLGHLVLVGAIQVRGWLRDGRNRRRPDGRAKP